ncbi:tetratricopeptide repeat protein [Candidatus Poribacteria bacterium]|nr:tetratricopeptide repeat protein [Candidatus Poribacteria bacterium]
MWDHQGLIHHENRRSRGTVSQVKWKHCVIGMLLFMFTTWGSGDILRGDITAYPKTFQEQLTDAQRAFQAEQWQEAFHLYQALTEEAPELPIAHIGKGDAAAKLKDYPTAIPAFQRALQHLSTEQHADIAIARLRFIVQAKLATAYHRNKQLDEADMWFQKAVKGAGEDAPVAWYVALGQIETERGNLEQARRYYIVAVQLQPDTTAAYNNLGHVLLKLNRIDEADAVFREALTQDETLASAAFGRGEVGVSRGHLDVASHFYKHAIQHAPDEPTFHKSLADVLRGMGNSEAAEASEARYRRTLAERYLRQAHWFIEKQQLQRALGPLKKALETDGTFIPVLKDYAYVQMQLGELAAAKQTYQRVLTVEPTSRQALLHLGMIEAQLGNVTNAAAHYLSLIKHNPDFMDTYVQLANLYESSGDLAAAEQALTMGIEHATTWAPGYLWRGKIYQKQRASDLAETDFRHAIQLAPDVPFPKEALASLLAMENRKLAEALILAETVVKRDSRPAHRATLAFVYYRLNRIREARREIEIAFTQTPKSPYVLKIRSQILKTDK